MNKEEPDPILAINRIALALERLASCIDRKKKCFRMVDVERGRVYKTHLGRKLKS